MKPRTIIVIGAAFGIACTAVARAQAMPNPKLTPGATSGLTAKQLCDPKFHTGTVRAVSERKSAKSMPSTEWSITKARARGPDAKSII